MGTTVCRSLEYAKKEMLCSDLSDADADARRDQWGRVDGHVAPTLPAEGDQGLEISKDGLIQRL